jgi:hypothetical protein
MKDIKVKTLTAGVDGRDEADRWLAKGYDVLWRYPLKWRAERAEWLRPQRSLIRVKPQVIERAHIMRRGYDAVMLALHNELMRASGAKLAFQIGESKVWFREVQMPPKRRRKRVKNFALVRGDPPRIVGTEEVRTPPPRRSRRKPRVKTFLKRSKSKYDTQEFRGGRR